jgi:hypothetical protein
MKVINAAGLAWSRAAPGLRRVAVIFNPDTSPQSKLFLYQSAEWLTLYGLNEAAIAASKLVAELGVH